MSTTLTPNAKLPYAAPNDPSWNVPVVATNIAIDAFNSIGDLCVSTHESPSATLDVDVSPGQFTDQSGTVQSYAGSTSNAIAASSTKVLYLDGTASWALVITAAYPTTPHVRLATVISGASTITGVTDNRQVPTISGQKNPAVTHLLSTAVAAPTIAAGSAAGTGPTVAVSGTDLAGTVSVTTGTSPGTGTVATVTFNVAFGSAPRAVMLTPANAATAAAVADWYAGTATTTTFVLGAGVALAASTAYVWNYLVVG